MPAASDAYRALPSVQELLENHTLREWERRVGHAVVTNAIRAELDAARAQIRAGGSAPMPALLIDSVTERIQTAVRPPLTRAINATGVILHTNLGRAPLAPLALDAIRQAAESYSNLEYDLSQGERGSRYDHARELLCTLTGAEDALVVNNNAAAIMFVLRAFATNKQVLISRGQLVEIGGGFRVPDVLNESGAHMVEVGTTNRTRLADFENAVTPDTALLLQVHPSNFRVVGFTEQVSLTELAALGSKLNVPVVHDLGSGALLDTAAYGLLHEPMPQESLRQAADLVTFSADKLLGGPQAGIILGKSVYVRRLVKHPLARALRVDKLTLAALQATLLQYLQDKAVQTIPVWQMIAAPLSALDANARAWAERWRARGLDATVINALSTVGGGSLPGETLPTRAVALNVPAPDNFLSLLRENQPPIIARIENDRVLIDPRTILPPDIDPLLEGVERAFRRSA